jgi:myo-inositol-1(or 4)-monophosphatase
VFDAIAGRIRRAVLPLLGTDEGREDIGRGAGGDRTVELDRRAEAEAVAELSALAGRGERFSLLSEEAGLVDMGADFPRVLLDPVDGSRNAKRGLPIVGTMMALLETPELRGVRAGFVLNTTSGERWHAIRGEGAFHDGRPIKPVLYGRPGTIEILGLETSARSLRVASALVERASRLRTLGSAAIALAHTATGGIDVYCTPTPHRLFDMAAGLLMIGEVRGVATDLGGGSLDDLPADLDTLTTVLCSAHPELHALALETMRA